MLATAMFLVTAAIWVETCLKCSEFLVSQEHNLRAKTVRFVLRKAEMVGSVSAAQFWQIVNRDTVLRLLYIGNDV